MTSSRPLRTIIGSILANFSRVELSTADEKTYTLVMNPLNRLAVRIIGVPHLGFRLRASIILREAATTARDGRILDAGCGYGICAMSLAEAGFSVEALDLEESRIQAINKMKGEYPTLKSLELKRGSVTALPFPAETFQTVVCSEVIEHVTDHEQTVRELARVLAHSGKLVLTVPYDSEHNRRIFKSFGHERPGYTGKSLAALLGENNLRIEKEYYYEHSLGNLLFRMLDAVTFKPLLGILFYPFYALYLLDSHFGFGEPNQMIVVARKV